MWGKKSAEKKSDNAPKPSDPLFGRLRELRATVQSLRGVTVELSEAGAGLVDKPTRDRERQALLEEDLGLFYLSYERAETLLAEIHRLLRDNGILYAGAGDSIGAIQAAWERVVFDWHKIIGAKGVDCAREFRGALAQLDVIVYECGFLTIPERIAEHLKFLPIGGVLNFRGAYADELPKAEDRRRLLTYLEFYPGFVQGLVDVKNERILRAAPKIWRRNFSFVAVLLLALGGYGFIAAACQIGAFPGLSDWPFTRARMVSHFVGYTFLILGALAHITVNLLKQDRSADSSPFLLSDWLLRIHVKENAFFLSALSLWLGPIAIAFMFKTFPGWQTAFFVGYSYDSFLDLFLRRFQAFAGGEKESIQAALSPKKKSKEKKEA